MTTLHIITGQRSGGQEVVSAVGCTGHIPHEIERLSMAVPIRIDVWRLQRGQVDRDVEWRLQESYVWH